MVRGTADEVRVADNLVTQAKDEANGIQVILILMFRSSHIFVFWCLVDSYQKTKISAVKFVDFSEKI